MFRPGERYGIMSRRCIFNEYRKFGDWYRTSPNEVRDDPAVYRFRETCSEQQSHVEVTTEFPVEQSFRDYRRGRIRLRDIRLITNPPVVARVDNHTGAYTFDLPYLFRVRKKMHTRFMHSTLRHSPIDMHPK
jgi:hypothetical protein